MFPHIVHSFCVKDCHRWLNCASCFNVIIGTYGFSYIWSIYHLLNELSQPCINRTYSMYTKPKMICRIVNSAILDPCNYNIHTSPSELMKPTPARAIQWHHRLFICVKNKICNQHAWLWLIQCVKQITINNLTSMRSRLAVNILIELVLSCSWGFFFFNHLLICW